MEIKHTNKRRKVYILIIIILLIIVPYFLFSIFLNRQVEDNEYTLENGQLIIQRPQRLETILKMSGEWDFYPSLLLDNTTYQHLGSLEKTSAHIPESWNKYSSGSSISGYGYGTYHVYVQGVEPGISLALYIPTTATANKVFIDESMVFKAGNVSKETESFIPSYKTGMIRFTPTSENFHIFIQISNFIYARGGLWHEPILGYEEVVANYNAVINEKDFFLLGSFLIMIIIHLIIFILRKNELEHLLISVLALTAIIRIFVSGNYLIYRIVNHITFKLMFVFEYLAFYWIAIIFILLTRTLFYPNKFKKLIHILLLYVSAMSFLTIIATVRFSSSIIQISQIIAILITFFGIAITCRALIENKEGASLILMGAYIATIFALHDMLFYNNIISNNFGELITSGLFIAVLLQSVTISVRYTRNINKMEELSRHLIRLDKLKSDFLVSTSHELRTPLNGILALTDSLLKGSNGQLNLGQKEKMELVSISARRLTYLVNDILDVTRLENNDLQLDIRAVQIEGVIRSVIKVFQTLSIPKGIDVEIHLPDEIPYIMADENRISQILYNLLGNALKYTKQGHINIEVEVNRGRVVICVADTGIGISAERVEHIFDGRVQGIHTQRAEGNGIGLVVCKKLIEMQNGRIWVKSVLGKGSAFYFTLPIAHTTQLSKGEKDREIVQRELSNGSMKNVYTGTRDDLILIVDDELINLKGAEALLQIEGYQTITAQSGRAALEIFNEKKQDISLVILDLMLPDISGYEVCSIMRQETPLYELPILMLTAKNRIEDLAEGLRTGANDFLSKPFESTEFAIRVNTLIHLKNSVAKAINSEFAFLQAQIKPHFLFNALNTIVSFCYEDSELAAQLLLDLGKFLRTSFDFKYLREEIPVEQEIEMVQAFTAIESARFGNELVVEYHIQEQVKGMIPPLSIQPLVENAIIHGVRKHSGLGKVIVNIYNRDDRLCVEVTDNGMGMNRESIVSIFSKETEGIGLWNINNRLIRMYGSRLKVESEISKGTVVSFVIPYGGTV